MNQVKQQEISIYHGGSEIIYHPEIRIGRYTKDFYWGFYCTILPKQAERWASRNLDSSIVNVYKCKITEELNVKVFEHMTDEWLEQISFHTARALACLTYERSYDLNDKDK